MHKLIVLLFVLMTMLCMKGNAIADDRVNIYDIIFDVGVHDRESYHEIMKLLVKVHRLGAGNVAGVNEDGYVVYTTNITIFDEYKRIVYNKVFAGSYKADYSDVIKAANNYKPPIPKSKVEDMLREDGIVFSK